MKQIEKQDHTELYQQFQTRTGSLSSEADFTAAMNTIYGDVDFKGLNYVKDDKSAEGYEGTYGVYSKGRKVSTLNLRKENENMAGGNRHAKFRQPELPDRRPGRSAGQGQRQLS